MRMMRNKKMRIDAHPAQQHTLLNPEGYACHDLMSSCICMAL
jgi:hypothetical protein